MFSHISHVLLVHQCLDVLFSVIQLKMSETVTEMFGCERGSDNDMIIDSYNNS